MNKKNKMLIPLLIIKTINLKFGEYTRCGKRDVCEIYLYFHFF